MKSKHIKKIEDLNIGYLYELKDGFDTFIMLLKQIEVQDSFYMYPGIVSPRDPGQIDVYILGDQIYPKYIKDYFAMESVIVSPCPIQDPKFNTSNHYQFNEIGSREDYPELLL